MHKRGKTGIFHVLCRYHCEKDAACPVVSQGECSLALKTLMQRRFSWFVSTYTSHCLCKYSQYASDFEPIQVYIHQLTKRYFPRNLLYIDVGFLILYDEKAKKTLIFQVLTFIMRLYKSYIFSGAIKHGYDELYEGEIQFYISW